MPALLQFASTVQELSTMSEWPVESEPPTPGVEEGGTSGSASAGKFPNSVSSFLGVAKGLSRPGCKFVHKADLDMPVTDDVFLRDHATLSKADRPSIMWSLDQQKHIANAREGHATDVFLTIN
eukprot:8253450-Karenia_brevis.AAC.1